MHILYIGDVMGEAGLQVVEHLVHGLRNSRQIDLVIAQAENVTEGKSMTLIDFKRLQKAGIDFCTGGNWSLHREELFPALNDPAQTVIRPANYPTGTPGLGYKYAKVGHQQVLVVSLLGGIVGRDAAKPVDNPLQVIDKILSAEENTEKAGIIVNLHGDYSSEKVVIGHYLDGKVTAVVGDHWHVPTADARVLPAGTAHITDVGMCGTLDSSLGVTYESIIPRWRNGVKTRNILAIKGPKQFNAVLIKTNENGLADSIEQIQQTI